MSKMEDKTKVLMDYLEMLLRVQDKGEINCNAKIRNVLEAIDESLGLQKIKFYTGGLVNGVSIKTDPYNPFTKQKDYE